MSDTSPVAVGKPAVQSTTVWSDVSTIVLGGLGIASSLGVAPAGAITAAVPLVGPALVVIAGLVGIWGRYRPSIQPIVGLISNPAKRKLAEQIALKAAVDAALAARDAQEAAQPADPVATQSVAQPAV